MNRQIKIHAFIGSLALAAGAAVSGCSPPASQSSTVAATAPAPKAGHEVCTEEVITHTRPSKDKDQIAGTAAGAIIGGVIGNKVGGKGDSKTVATVAGAAAGGYAGNQIQESAQKNNTYQETKRTCRMVYD